MFGGDAFRGVVPGLLVIGGVIGAAGATVVLLLGPWALRLLRALLNWLPL